LEVGEVDPRREGVSFTTGVALSPGPIVPLNCAEGIAVLGREDCKDIILDWESSDPASVTGGVDGEGCSDTSLLISAEA
jgi:hypothetical protein